MREWLGSESNRRPAPVYPDASQLLTRLGEGTAAVRSATGPVETSSGSKNTKRAPAAAKKTGLRSPRARQAASCPSDSPEDAGAWARRKKQQRRLISLVHQRSVAGAYVLGRRRRRAAGAGLGTSGN